MKDSRLKLARVDRLTVSNPRSNYWLLFPAPVLVPSGCSVARSLKVAGRYIRFSLLFSFLPLKGNRERLANASSQFFQHIRSTLKIELTRSRVNRAISVPANCPSLVSIASIAMETTSSILPFDSLRKQPRNANIVRYLSDTNFWYL